MKKNVLINFYPMLLWNTWVLGNKNRALTKTNFYEKEVEVNTDGSGEISSVKSDLLESAVRKANIFEVLIIKYLPIVVFTVLFLNLNLYYVSMVGLFLGTTAYLLYGQVKKYISEFFGNFMLLSLFIVYIVVLLLFPIDSFDLKVNWIVNYSVQYFLWIYMFERVFIDIYSLDFTKWYKLEKSTLTYFKINDNDEKDIYANSVSVAKKFFTGFLFVIMSVSLFLGGVDLATKILVKNEAENRVLTKTKDERKILQKRNAEALNMLLESQSKELGIRVHTKDDLALLHSDFEKYIKTKPIAYELVRVGKNNKLVNLKDGKEFKINFGNKSHLLFKCWVMMYPKDGVYRWYLKYKGETLVIMNIKAR